jgi:hypothetical protein
MTGEQEALLAELRSSLRRARQETSSWNTENQHALLLAMQFDRDPADLPLARHLLRRIVADYREHRWLGVGRNLLRAGLLVAEQRQVEDVWLHWEATALSFDTELGYGRFLAAAGVEATLAFVRASDHPDREHVAERLTRLHQDGVAGWLAARQAEFPADPADESRMNWAHHAQALGHSALARRLLLALAEESGTAETLNSVQFWLDQMGFLADAVAIQREYVACTEASHHRASALMCLGDLLRRSGDVAGAWETLRECGPLMPNDDFWRGAGLWRHFVRDHFRLVPLAPDDATAMAWFAKADRLLVGIPRIWMDGLLGAVITAVEHLSDATTTERYRPIQAAAERERAEALRT